ncbi:ATP-dependent Lon protease [Breznakia sp. PF5-3]|uniref:endopeptidase La n=1 Tax=unclassified Breznakia TaxID=2623764 RepID=UPI00240767DE|nr:MULTISPECIES: endopeptidase La [unclassified Breznakia]MDF9824113.1 ATP-dependent Lon protease [Breznakia sp. PM6-1]MDF9834911.1 ATP-dependent Lon protease [Breznakia sp. PF5-3]MDF9837220.1 ATP-dependent Lon protease [Breznakia sp. PFB2-8]MDF9859210.1 ATP-dependent Lon protease [Breznakia sp. PH5-24]
MGNKVELPVVCTRGVIVFPNNEIIIDVGRKKSVYALEEAQEHFQSQVLLVAQKDLALEDPRMDDLYEVGTICHILHIRHMDGYLRVKFKGLERARISSLEFSDEMVFGSVEPLIDVQTDVNEELALVRRIARQLENVEVLNQDLPKDMITKLAEGISATNLADQVAQIFPFSVEAKQRILEAADVNDRLLYIIQEMENEKQINELDTLINDKVKQRLDENQREYYLREKLRAIKEELGDVADRESDTDEYRKMIAENPYPESVKEKALEELSRYEMLPSASGESGVVKSYLDWLLKLPWWQESTDNEDLNKAQEILDEDHYGLEKVKERIMEYLAVKTMTNSLKAPIICLVGPPGVGKTSLSKSVARALDREFVKISLGGVKDESEIRGHRRTYLGSMPGRFIQGMKKAGTINPVFLIDEIDKMGADYKGDPASAMLEVLDPEQNSYFSDHYLEEPYDLSKVLFIATANYMDNIPHALQDRLEIIQLSSYTEVEKLEIAKRHLVPKQLKENGLKASQFKISDEMLSYVIKHYTRESGVRQLERVIAALARKSVLAILKDKKKTLTMTKKTIQKFLGKEIFDYGKKEHKDQVGTVTGLAYTSFGGDILQIEVNHFDGKGKLVVTGQLGDVMKESATIAYDYVRANAKKYKIDSSIFENQDVHIHVPEGAVPKDGPSAGVTLTTALISSLSNKAVKNDVAMTGEVTLRGNVLPIGGLKEKSMAAHRSGIKTIVMPKANVKDLDDIPETVKESIKFIPVEHMSQVLNAALVK